jgi:6,7-dimethyl-8-ribityllumazine synthase
MTTLEGKPDAAGKSFGIAVSRFNSEVTRKLLEGACQALLSHGAKDEDITVAWVPGAAEIPQVLRRLADSRKFHALIALGCVIRGDTTHFERVASLVTEGVGRLSDGRLPIAFGVLTTENLEQALERAGSRENNKGWEAALVAAEMATLWEKLP